MESCEHDGCTSARGKRSPFCTEHKAEHRRAWNRDRMRRKREEQAEKLLGVTAVSDGRSIPGQGADARQPPTQHHPSRRFARREEPDVIDYTQPGATAHRSAFERQTHSTDLLQRYRARRVEDDSWVLQDDYYGGVTFPRPEMGEGPYRGGYVPAGTPQLWQVVKGSSRL